MKISALLIPFNDLETTSIFTKYIEFNKKEQNRIEYKRVGKVVTHAL
jgi:hypothetical protein